MIPALAAAVALLADGAAFALAVPRLGIAGESNGIPVALYVAVGINGILAAKVAQAILAAILARRLASSSRAHVRAFAYTPALVGAFGAATALVAILR